MPYTISIDGEDRTADIINQSVVYEDIINDQINSCSFVLIDKSGDGIPDPSEEVIITLADSTIVFAGYIIGVNISAKGDMPGTVNVRCVDYTWLLDRNLVHQTYEDMTDKEIIESIVATYCPGLDITTNNVIEGVTIDQISFNYVQPSQALRKICDLTGRNWYIDYEKDIHYFELSENPAPFDIDSSNDEYIDLRINKDSSQLKNRVYVRGGTKLSDETFYEELGDGVKTQFVLPDRPHNVTVKVNGVEESLGIKNIDTSGFDWYLNYQEKYLEQDAGGAVLTSSDTLRIEYQYDIPILVALEDPTSVMASGEREFAIFDKSITTTEAARDRAQAELTDYANSIIEGSFTTYTPGFISGQTININLSAYGINDDYIIQKVRGTSRGAGEYVYEISIASAKTMGIIRFLIELLEANKNLIELDDQEVIDELFNLTDALLSDSLLDSLTIDSTGGYATWSENNENLPVTVGKWELFQWM